MTSDTKIYVQVGGAGNSSESIGATLDGGYNGGGSVTGNSGCNHIHGSGGGATSISLVDGELKNLSGNKSNICFSAKEIPSLGKASLGNIITKNNKITSITKIK